MVTCSQGSEINNITIENVSSKYPGRQAINSVSESGLNASDEHDTNPGAMWLSNAELLPEITYDLGAVFALQSIKVWDYNEAGLLTKRGVYNVDIPGATYPEDFTFTINTNFSQAPGTVSDFSELLDLNATARYIKLNVKSNHGDGSYTGLSEFKFFGEPANVLALSNPAVSALATNSASISTTLSGTNASETLYWLKGNRTPPFDHTGWASTNGPLPEATGLVVRAMTGLTADTLYTAVFFATDTIVPAVTIPREQPAANALSE